MSTPVFPMLTFTFYGSPTTISPEFGLYDNGRLAIMLNDDEGPFGTLTVNLPNDHLNPGEVFIKDWSENSDVVVALLEAGWIKYTGREVASGFVIPKVAVMSGDLLKFANFLGIKAMP